MTDSVRTHSGTNEAALTGSAVSAAYDRWAVQYDTDRNLTRDLDARVLRQSTRLDLTGRRVLEFGCGTGKNTEYLAQYASAVVAMDFSAGMLAMAERRVPRSHVRFVQHDVREPWPLEDNSVDVAIGNLVLEHVERLAPVFAEAARVLGNGGQLYLCELHPYRQWRGGQAHFTEQSSGDTVQVSAFVHSVSDYVNAALDEPFTLVELGEWLEDDAPAGAFPRLLSLQFTRATRL